MASLPAHVATMIGQTFCCQYLRFTIAAAVDELLVLTVGNFEPVDIEKPAGGVQGPNPSHESDGIVVVLAGGRAPCRSAPSPPHRARRRIVSPGGRRDDEAGRPLGGVTRQRKYPFGTLTLSIGVVPSGYHALSGVMIILHGHASPLPATDLTEIIAVYAAAVLARHGVAGQIAFGSSARDEMPPNAGSRVAGNQWLGNCLVAPMVRCTVWRNATTAPAPTSTAEAARRPPRTPRVARTRSMRPPGNDAPGEVSVARNEVSGRVGRHGFGPSDTVR